MGIERNIKWYEMRNSRTLNSEGIANFTRNTLAQSLRRNPYLVFVIQAGFDAEKGPSLYWMDYFGSLASPNATAQGLCSYFLLSLFDRHWKKDMTLDDGLKLVEMCIDQLSKRYVISLKSFIIKIVDKKEVDPDAPKGVTGMPINSSKDQSSQPKV